MNTQPKPWKRTILPVPTITPANGHHLRANSTYRRFGKRLLDLLLTIPAFVVLLPVQMIIAILVWLAHGWPIYFCQDRPGLDGRPFSIIKYRTMTNDRDSDGELLPDEDRLTPVGKFLRQTSLDELPELINVLRGEMSLVGPRPLLMEYLDLYTPEQMRRHEAKPGVTGWAQVNGRNLISWEKKFEMDVWYVDHVSLWQDIKILLQTVWKVVTREGINQPGQATAEHFRGSQEVKPAIVLSGHTMALGVVRALGEQKVPVFVVHFDERDMAHVSKYVRQEIVSPNPAESEELFIEHLVEQAAHFGNGLLIPASDETLVAVSRHKDLLQRHYMVACTEWGITQDFIEKKYTFIQAAKDGVPHPKTLIPRNLSEVEEYIEQVQFPCLVKPSQSHRYYEHFKRKMVLAEDAEQVLSAYEQAQAVGLEVMLQEVIPGDDSLGVNYNAYFWDGEPLVEFTAQQLRNAPPDFGSPRAIVSKWIPEVIEPGRKILKGIGFYGYACTEFKQDPRDGIYKLMEVNGRHNLSSLLAVRCGINFPWLQYQHLVFGQLPSAADFRKDVYWIDITRDVGYSLQYLGKEKYRLGQYLRPYLRPHVYAILDLADPAPFVRRVVYLAGEAGRTVIAALRRRVRHLSSGRKDPTVDGT